MASKQLTPRQKMINMMYLVLTAILALNVSAEVLNAFKSVNDGIAVSNLSLQAKNASIYADLNKELQSDSLKAQQAYTKAQQARQLSSKLYKLLEQDKQLMIKDAGGLDVLSGKIKHDDDIEISTRLFVENNNGAEGKKLKTEIESTRNELLKLLNDNQRNEVETSLALQVDEPKNGKTWEYAKFNQVPVVAAVTLITKFQNDLLSAESHVVEKLYSSINAKLQNVDKMEARIISPHSYVLQGEQYKADVMVAAYSSTQHPDVFLGAFNSTVTKDAGGKYVELTSSSEVPPLVTSSKIDVDGGQGKVLMAAGATGNKKYTGVVRVKNVDGKYEFYPFEGEYQVAPKVAVVSPKMMNVLYIGLDNPVDISVPGVSQSDVSAVFEGNGTLQKGEDGTYKALVTNTGLTKVKVSAKVDGRIVPMGEQQFRIKNIPNPTTTVDGISNGGGVPAHYVQQRKGIVPKSDDFIYSGVPWKVIKYTVTIRFGDQSQKIENEGPMFTKKVMDMAKALKKGDGFFVEEIVVRGPDNRNRIISPLAYNITGP